MMGEFMVFGTPSAPCVLLCSLIQRRNLVPNALRNTVLPVALIQFEKDLQHKVANEILE